MHLDGQFFVVTLAALWGGWILLRPLLRWRSEKKTGACGRCSSPGCVVDPVAKSSDLVTIGPRRSQSS